MTSLAQLDASVVASGGTDGSVRLWDLRADMPCVATFFEHEAAVYALAAVAGNLLSASWDRSVKHIRLRMMSSSPSAAYSAASCDSRSTRTLLGHTDAVRALTVCSERYVASAGWDSTVRVWDLEAAEGHETAGVIRPHTGWIYALAYLPPTAASAASSASASCGSLLSGSGDKSIAASSPVTRAPTQSLSGHSNTVWALTTLSEHSFASAGADGKILLWDTQHRKATEIVGGHREGSSVYCLDSRGVEQRELPQFTLPPTPDTMSSAASSAPRSSASATPLSPASAVESVFSDTVEAHMHIEQTAHTKGGGEGDSVSFVAASVQFAPPTPPVATPAAAAALPSSSLPTAAVPAPAADQALYPPDHLFSLLRAGQQRIERHAHARDWIGALSEVDNLAMLVDRALESKHASSIDLSALRYLRFILRHDASTLAWRRVSPLGSTGSDALKRCLQALECWEDDEESDDEDAVGAEVDPFAVSHNRDQVLIRVLFETPCDPKAPLNTLPAAHGSLGFAHIAFPQITLRQGALRRPDRDEMKSRVPRVEMMVSLLLRRFLLTMELPSGAMGAGTGVKVQQTFSAGLSLIALVDVAHPRREVMLDLIESGLMCGRWPECSTLYSRILSVWHEAVLPAWVLNKTDSVEALKKEGNEAYAAKGEAAEALDKYERAIRLAGEVQKVLESPESTLR